MTACVTLMFQTLDVFHGKAWLNEVAPENVACGPHGVRKGVKKGVSSVRGERACAQFEIVCSRACVQLEIAPLSERARGLFARMRAA